MEENKAEIIFEDSKSGLEDLKEDYEVLKNEFSLPDFDSLNADFGIEKIQGDETDFLVREVRRYISEKFSLYLRFIESILQPSNSQMFVFMMIKSLGSDDSIKLQEIYKTLAKKEIEVFELDLKYSLDAEVNFINSANDIWQGIKEELLLIIGKIRNNWSDDSVSVNKSRNYFM